MMRARLLFVLALLCPISAYAADNAALITPCGSGCVTMRSKDVGVGVQSLIQILGDTAGTPLATAPGTGNTSFALPIQGVAGGVAVPISGTVTANAGTNLNTSALALETGGNLATIAGAVNAGAMIVKQATAGNLNATVVGTGTFAVQATLQASATTAIGKVDPNTPANWSIGATAAGVPANAFYAGMNVGGNLTGLTGTSNGLKVDPSAVTSPVSVASAQIVNGASVAQGSTTDSPCTLPASGTGCSQVAIEKAIANAANSPPPLGTSGGITPLKLNGLTNAATAIKASAGQLLLLQCGNTNASEAYVQVYNVASGSVTVGTTTPTLSVPIAATSTGGFSVPLVGLQFGTAISAAATTTATGGTAPGTALDCNAGYN